MKKKDRRIKRHTGEELEKRAKITRGDRNEAADAWKKFAPARFKGILDAKPHRVKPRGRAPRGR